MKPRRIVFLGTHGQYNIGDELLLETFLTQLGPEHRYVVNSYDTAFTRAQLADRFSVTVIDTARDRPTLLRALLTCDVLCFGGGSIVKELNASTGRNRYSTLLMILAVVTFCRRVARRPIAMLNVGVGPVRTRRGLRLARMVLTQVTELTVRDARSRALCDSIGVTARLSTDAVFAVAPESLLEDAPSAEPLPPTPIRVALNLNHDIEDPANWEPFLARLAQALDTLHTTHPIELHTLPMQTGFKDHDDTEVLAEFASRTPAIPVIHHRISTPRDAARVIRGCDIVISERLHAIVLAAILGVPAFALVYDVKVAELTTMLGQQRWSVDINTPFAPDDLAEDLTTMIRERSAIADRVSRASSELRTRARDDFASARRWITASRRGLDGVESR